MTDFIEPIGADEDRPLEPGEPEPVEEPDETEDPDLPQPKTDEPEE